MVAPLVAAALIGGGAAIVGGAISNRSNKKAAAAEAALQREFAQKGIQWTVEDAKAAGIHPLYALQGGQAASYTPVSRPDAMGPAVAQAGQVAARAVVGAGKVNINKRTAEAQLAVLESQARRNNSEADLLSNRLDSMGQSFGGGLGGPGSMGRPEEVPDNLVQLEPQKVIPTKPGERAVSPYSNPFWERHILYTNPLTGNDWYIFTPRADNPAEGLEGLGATAMTFIGTLSYYLGQTAGAVRRHYSQLQKKYPATFKQVIKMVDRYLREKKRGLGPTPYIQKALPPPKVRGMDLPMEGFR